MSTKKIFIELDFLDAFILGSLLDGIRHHFDDDRIPAKAIDKFQNQVIELFSEEDLVNARNEIYNDFKKVKSKTQWN